VYDREGVDAGELLDLRLIGHRDFGGLFVSIHD
jgi:hypothetical protein